jgi:hypothetical protein
MKTLSPIVFFIDLSKILEENQKNFFENNEEFFNQKIKRKI